MKINHRVVMTGSESQTSMKMLFDVAPPAPPQRAKIGRAGDPGRLRFGLRQCGVGLILRLPRAYPSARKRASERAWAKFFRA